MVMMTLMMFIMMLSMPMKMCWVRQLPFVVWPAPRDAQIHKTRANQAGQEQRQHPRQTIEQL